jgi:hypothetical protein
MRYQRQGRAGAFGRAVHSTEERSPRPAHREHSLGCGRDSSSDRSVDGLLEEKVRADAQQVTLTANEIQPRL